MHAIFLLPTRQSSTLEKKKVRLLSESLRVKLLVESKLRMRRTYVHWMYASGRWMISESNCHAKYTPILLIVSTDVPPPPYASQYLLH